MKNYIYELPPKQMLEEILALPDAIDRLHDDEVTLAYYKNAFPHHTDCRGDFEHLLLSYGGKLTPSQNTVKKLAKRLQTLLE